MHYNVMLKACQTKIMVGLLIGTLYYDSPIDGLATRIAHQGHRRFILRTTMYTQIGRKAAKLFVRGIILSDFTPSE